MTQTNKISAISIIKNEIKEEKIIKAVKQKVSLEFLHEQVKIFQTLAEQIKNYEIADHPEMDINNLDMLDYLVDQAEDGKSEMQEVLHCLYEDLIKRAEICGNLEEEEANQQYNNYMKDIMSCETHLNPIETKFS